MEIHQLSSYKPYLLRAFYEWLLKNNLTPYLLVDIAIDGVIVPIAFASNGKIVLNISPSAVKNLILTNDKIHFNASFSGTPSLVVVPMAGVLAMYSSENCTGIMFESKIAHNEQLTLVGNDNARRFRIKKFLISLIDNLQSDDALASDSLEECSSPLSGKKRTLLRIVK